MRQSRSASPSAGSRRLRTVRRIWLGLPLGWLLPLAFFVIGLLYIYAAPHFEASDSVQHIGMIKWIAERGALPVQSPDHEEIYAQQASQPPLYYLLMAPLWSLMDTSDFDAFLHPSPMGYSGAPTRLGNRSMVNYRKPYPPDLRGASLALYLIRIATLGMGAVSVAAVYRSALLIKPGHKGFALLATAFTAFNPQYLFIGVSVSNDGLVTMLAALIVWQALAMLRNGFQTRRSLVLALLLALASLAKVSGFVPGAVAGAAAVWLFVRGRDRRGFLIFCAAMLFVWLAVAGWWYARNLMLYDEFFGTSAMVANYGSRTTTVERLMADEFEGLRISYWALFGVFSILVHDVFYGVMDALCLIAGLGLLVFLLKSRRDPFALQAFGLVTLLLSLNLASYIWWNLQTVANTGRLLFPSIAAISLLLALGLHALRVPALAIALPLCAFAIAAPFVYIVPQYDHPPVVAALPSSAQPTYARWDNITLAGYELPPPSRWSPGDNIPITLYWQPLAQSDAFQALFITLIDAQGQDLATIDSFPGWGALPTTWWQPDLIYRDDYILQIPRDIDAWTTAQLHIGWYDWQTRRRLQPLTESGEPSAGVYLPIGALVSGGGQRLGPDATPVGTLFGDAIQLDAFTFADGHHLALEWRIVAEIEGDWRVFAVVFAEPFQSDAELEILSQADAAPQAPLDFLHIGESFVTRHDFQLPEGYEARHSIYVGWYNDDLVARLALPYPADMLPLPAQVFRG